jgi:hypothetical protein
LSFDIADAVTEERETEKAAIALFKAIFRRPDFTEAAAG